MSNEIKKGIPDIDRYIAITWNVTDQIFRDEDELGRVTSAPKITILKLEK
jgi:hypothetical protein